MPIGTSKHLIYRLRYSGPPYLVRSTNPPMPKEPPTHVHARILLVDNGQASSARIHQLLGRHVNVQRVENVASALEASLNFRPDAVIASITERDFEPLALLRRDPALRDVPTILLSAKAESEAFADELHVDFDDYIDPTISEQELIARIQATLNGARMRARRNERYRLLIEMDDVTRPLIDPDEITYTVAAMLGQHLGVNRCAYADVEADQDTFNLTGNYNHGVPSIIGRYQFAQFGAECLRLMRAGLPYTVTDSESDVRTAEVIDTYRQTGIRAVICVPLMKAGRMVAAMAVHSTTPRAWRSDETELLLMVANRCWESIERTRVTRELRDNEARYRTLVETISSVVWHTDQDGSIIKITPRGRRLPARLSSNIAGGDGSKPSILMTVRKWLQLGVRRRHPRNHSKAPTGYGGTTVNTGIWLRTAHN